jgi:uncharacterized protein
MRPPQARPRVQRRWLVIGGILLLLFISINSIVRFYTDWLWFQELKFTGFFWSVLRARVGIGVVGGLVAGLVVFANLEIARRAAPKYRFVTAGTDVAEQYRSAFRPYARLANILLAGLIAFFTGLSTSAIWDRYLLWKNARPFGIKAPAPFGGDVSFYVFGIPFQRAILSWLFGIVIASLLFSVVAHLFNGSIQPETNRIRVATVVKAHVSALLGVLVLIKAFAYRLDTFDLVYSTRGVITGASYTDVHAQRPALRLLMVIAIVAAVILFVNVFRFQGWLLPGAAVALWAFTSIVAGAVVPFLVQRFQVVPQESVREREYIKLNIAQTRSAFNLAEIDVQRFPAKDSLTSKEVGENEGTIDNVRVWDPAQLHPTYQRLQAIRTYYDFDDVDIDRYQLNGRMTQTMLSGREVDASKLPGAESWVNRQLSYTHGYGHVANPANAVSSEGLPQFIVRGLPPKGPAELLARQSGIYYGERLTGYAVANTKQEEIDYSKGDQEVVTGHYKGKGGIELNNIGRRLAFAARFGDTDLAISDFIRPQSRLIMRRNIRERLTTAAPFLQFDNDPYLVVAGGKYYWVVDAYTSTDRFPYAERVDLGQLVGGTLQGESNYMRNSVKAVVDAYDGTTSFYLMDESDALAATYQAAFPSLFKPKSEMPSELVPHLRYPVDLFKVQAVQYRAYHILDPQRLYEREDTWDIPNDPVQSSAQTNVAMEPYYVVMKLPGTKDEEFLLMMPFTPKNKPNLNGWLAARMDPGHYGEVVEYSFPREETIPGPENIAARIEQNGVISNQFTLWEGAGSTIARGNLLVIPIAQSLMYVQPIYLQASEAGRALPELRRVIVVIGDRIGFEPTFQEALDAVLKGTGPALETGGANRPSEPEDGETDVPTGDVKELLRQAVDHFRKADAALKQGDLATYQRENDAGRRAVEQAQAGA